MSDTDIINVEITVSRKDLKALARPGQKVASRDEVREFVRQAFAHELLIRKVNHGKGVQK